MRISVWISDVCSSDLQRLDRIRHEARDEGERQDPDRAVEAARQADPRPEIGDADDEPRNGKGNGRSDVDDLAPGHIRPVAGIAEAGKRVVEGKTVYGPVDLGGRS